MNDPLANPPWWALVIAFAALLPLLLLIRRRSPAQIAELFEHDLLTRFGGLCLVALGCGIFLVLHYHPLLQVLRRAPTVPYSRGTVFLAILAAGSGAIMLITGSRFRHILTLPGQVRTPAKTYAAFALIAAGIAGEVTLYWFFVSRGYRW